MTPSTERHPLQRLHEVTQWLAFSALRHDPNPVTDLDPIDQDDDDQEREQ